MVEWATNTKQEVVALAELENRPKYHTNIQPGVVSQQGSEQASILTLTLQPASRIQTTILLVSSILLTIALPSNVYHLFLFSLLECFLLCKTSSFGLRNNGYHNTL